MQSPPQTFSIIIPVYCNEPSLRSLHTGLCAGAAPHPGIEHEFIFVHDGSEDASFARLAELAASDPRVRVVRLSRNFGSHSAYLAGLSVARGQCVAGLPGNGPLWSSQRTKVQPLSGHASPTNGGVGFMPEFQRPGRCPVGGPDICRVVEPFSSRAFSACSPSGPRT